MSHSTSKSRSREQSKSTLYVLKVILLGDWNTGKTTLLRKYCLDENSNSDEQSSHRFVQTTYEKKVEKNGYNILLRIHDTAGQERYRSITQSYYRGAHGCITVFNVANETSMFNVFNWMDDLNTYNCASELLGSVLVGTAKEPCERQVSKEKAHKLSEHFDMPYLEASLDSKLQITEIFEKLIENMLDKLQSRHSNFPHGHIDTCLSNYNVKPKKSWTCTC